MRLTRALALAALLGGVPLGTVVAQDAGPPGATDASPSMTEAVAAAIDAFDAARQAFFDEYGKLDEDDEAAQAALFERYPRPDAYVERVWSALEGHESEPDAVAGLTWIVQAGDSDDAKGRALDLMLAHHLTHPGLGEALSALAYDDSPKSETFLESVLEKAEDRGVKGLALYTLASRFHMQAQWRAESADDAARLDARAEPLLERVVAEFADVESGRGTLGERAGRTLFAIRNLAIGKVAPDVVGVDVDGRRLALSDFRGKVVVVDFWGFW